jgi:hypothetical protein
MAAFAVANVLIAAVGWYTTTLPMSRLYASDRRVVEAARTFEHVTGAPLCVQLSRRVIGWHGIDFRWRLFDRMTDYTGRKNEAPCVVATIDYLDGHDPTDFAERLIATERPPPAMHESLGLFVDAGPARELWKSTSPRVRFESFMPLPDDERIAEVTIRQPVKPSRLSAGDTINVDAHVTNKSMRTTWPAIQDGPYRIWLGARTFLEGTDKAVGEYRARLAKSLAPGEAADVSIVIGPFAKAGRYRVDIGMLQEGVAWFPDRVELDIEVDEQ